jgi:hypothetical protein
MRRQCILSENHQEYETETQCVSYVVQRANKSRFMIFQYQNTGNENFTFIELDPNVAEAKIEQPQQQAQAAHVQAQGGPGLFVKQQYAIRREIINAVRAREFMEAEGNFYHMEILPKETMNTIESIIATGDFIRSTSLVAATKYLTDKINAAVTYVTGKPIEINPIEITLSVADRVAEKKGENRPLCVIL